MTTQQRLGSLKTLLNECRPPGRHLSELGTKRKCSELYGRPIGDRTWRRWKSEVLAQGWTYADTVCLRFLALGRSGNGKQGKMQRYGRERLIQDINRAIQDSDIETGLIPPHAITGAELEDCLSRSFGSCSQRQWRNRGVYRRKVYTATQAQEIFEKLAG